jgi:3-hydroxyisobutyrate dehydrogenase
MKEKIGFIGLGLMGTAMATRLLNTGYTLSVFNRTKTKAEALINQGAIWRDSPKIVAAQSDIIISMISTPAVLEKITLNSDGILAGLRKGGIHIDCSTVSPELTKQLVKKYEKHECHFLHSPVLGGVKQINEGSLLLFVGGKKKAYQKVEAVLNIFSRKTWHFEEIEHAGITKLLCNSYIAGMVVILAQSLVLAKKSGIPPKTVLEIISQSQLAASIYQIKGTAMIDRNFSPRFYIEHIFKDINLLLDVAKSINVPFPIGKTTQEVFSHAIQSGFAFEDYSAVIKVLEAEAGINNE